MTLQQVVALARQQTVPLAVRQQLVLGWFCGGRLGDVLQLRREDITLDSVPLPDLPNIRSVTIKFRRGKGVSANQKPFSIHTALTAEFSHLFDNLFEKKAGWMWEFPTAAHRKEQMVKLNAALKEIDPSFSTRSIRRGACQHLAALGVPVKDIMKLTNHATEKMCQTYLNMGTADLAGAAEGARLGVKLVTEPPPPPNRTH
jgi:integrase